jgi:hypothetical protein
VDHERTKPELEARLANRIEQDGDGDAIGSNTRIGHGKAKSCVTPICECATTEHRGPGRRATLVLAAKSGDGQAFEILIERYQRRILAVARRFTRTREDAEDIIQQSFQKAFVHLHEFEGKSSFSTWLTRIATRVA